MRISPATTPLQRRSACHTTHWLIALLVGCGPITVSAYASVLNCQSPMTLGGNEVFIPYGEAPGMKVKPLSAAGPGRVYLLTFAHGDEIASGLKSFARDHFIEDAMVTGVGAMECAITSWYDATRKKRVTRVRKGDREVTSLAGTLGVVGVEPYANIHFSGAERDGRVSGGHLLRGWAADGMELLVTATPLPFKRRLVEATGQFEAEMSDE